VGKAGYARRHATRHAAASIPPQHQLTLGGGVPPGEKGGEKRQPFQSDNAQHFIGNTKQPPQIGEYPKEKRGKTIPK